VVREEVGELAQLIYLRPLSTPRPAAEAAGSEEEVLEEVEGEVEVRVVNDWLKFRLHPDGYFEAEIEGERAPQRVAVQLGDGDRREAPVRFPVKSTAMKVYRIDEGERIDLKGDSVLLIAKLGHGIKRRREYANRLLELLEEIRGKVIVVGFFDRELGGTRGEGNRSGGRPRRDLGTGREGSQEVAGRGSRLPGLEGPHHPPDAVPADGEGEGQDEGRGGGRGVQDPQRPPEVHR